MAANFSRFASSSAFSPLIAKGSTWPAYVSQKLSPPRQPWEWPSYSSVKRGISITKNRSFDSAPLVDMTASTSASTTVTIYLDYHALAQAQETARLLAEIHGLRAEVEKLKADRLKVCRVIHLL